MRNKIETQIGMFSQYSNHEFSEELQRISDILDSMPGVVDMVAEDLAGGSDSRGAKGMSAESVLRAAVLLRERDWSYREMSFHIADSMATKAFLRLRDGQVYGRSTLQANISKILPETWEQINREIVVHAMAKKFENGKTVRVDSTVVGSHCMSAV